MVPVRPIASACEPTFHPTFQEKLSRSPTASVSPISNSTIRLDLTRPNTTSQCPIIHRSQGASKYASGHRLSLQQNSDWNGDLRTYRFFMPFNSEGTARSATLIHKPCSPVFGAYIPGQRSGAHLSRAIFYHSLSSCGSLLSPACHSWRCSSLPRHPRQTPLPATTYWQNSRSCQHVLCVSRMRVEFMCPADTHMRPIA